MSMPFDEKIFITDYNNQIRRIAQELIDKKEEIIKIKDLIKGANKIFICGNGGSAATASHFANDLQKSCCLQAISLTDNVPLITAIANDDDYKYIFSEQLLKLVWNHGDILIVFSGSGNSENIIEALKVASDHDIISIAILGSSEGKAARMEEPIKFIIDSDMQHAEDWHLIFGHIITRLIMEEQNG